MKKEEIHMRTPILQTLRRSPFDGLQQHFKLVRMGIIALDKAIRCYLEEDYINFKKYSDKVYKYEHKADLIKGNIRNHLPKFIFIPIDKGDFLALLKESDGILDSAEDIAVLMDMRRSKIPENAKENFRLVMKNAIKTVETLDRAMDMFKLMLETSFGGKTREDIKGVIYKVHKLEHESDVIEKKISKQLFNLEATDPITVMHMLKIVDRMGCIADHAENAADRIRATMAK